MVEHPIAAPPARPVALFVLGMSRSGTAAITRVLSLCGATLPPGMMGGFIGNPRGYWEPRKVQHLSEVILRRHGSAGYDPSLRMQEEGAFDAEEKAVWVGKIRAYLGTLPPAPVVVIKYPMIAAMTDLWFDAARQAGFDVMSLIAVRHPDEVMASWGKLGGKLNTGHSPQLGGALWLKYSLLSERHTRGLPRIVVEYANLLDNWRQEVKRVSAALALDLNTRDEGAIDEFLEPGLRHQREAGPVTETFGTDWLSTVYRELSAAARDEPWDEAALDRVYDAYRVNERAFRIAFEDFHRGYKINGRVPPFVGRLATEALAMAHLRRGTWA